MRDLFLVILFFIALALIPKLAHAEVRSLGRAGVHAGACSYFISKDGQTMFAFCSEDSKIPGKPPFKYFEVITIGSEPARVENDSLSLTHMLSANTLRLSFDSVDTYQKGPFFRTVHKVESVKAFIKIISNKTPMFVHFKARGVEHKFIFTGAVLNELKMIADL